MRAGQHRDAGAGAGDDDHGRRGHHRRQGAAEHLATTPRAGLPAQPGLADQAVRDLLDRHRALRLGSDPVQDVGELPFLSVHDVTSPVISSASPGASLSRASALAA